MEPMADRRRAAAAARWVGNAAQHQAAGHGKEQAGVLLQRRVGNGHLHDDRPGLMTLHLQVALAVAAVEHGGEPVVRAGAQRRTGGHRRIVRAQGLAGRVAGMEGDRLGDRACGGVEECAAVDVRRAEARKLGRYADRETHRGVAQDRPADGVAFLEGILDELSRLLVTQLVGRLVALRLLPGLGRLAHRSAELSLEEEVEMAGPDEGLSDVGWGYGVGRGPIVPSVGKHAHRLGLDGAAQQHAKDGCSAAKNAKRGKRDGQNAVLPPPFSSMRAAQAHLRFVSKAFAGIRCSGGEAC